MEAELIQGRPRELSPVRAPERTSGHEEAREKTGNHPELLRARDPTKTGDTPPLSSEDSDFKKPKKKKKKKNASCKKKSKDSESGSD